MDLTITDLLQCWSGGSEVERRANTRELLNIYNHRWMYLLKERINERFLEQNAEKLRLQADTSINLLRWVVDEIGAIYSQPANRTINGSSDGMEAYQNGGQIDHLFDAACKYTLLCRELAIRPLVVDGQVVFDLVTPDRFSVVPHPTDPTGILAIVIKLPDNKYRGDRAVFSVWTDATHFVADEQMRPIVNTANPEMINPYGSIPYIVAHARYPATSFFNLRDMDGLKEATINAGVQKTDHNHLRKLQSFKQLAVTGSTDEALGRMSMDPSSMALIKNPNASIQVLDMVAPLREHLDTIFLATRPTLITHGIWQDIVKGTTESSSGYALSIKQHKQATEWAKLRVMWRVYERQLYNMASLILEVETGAGLPPGELEVDYPEIGAASHPSDQADLATKYQTIGMSRANIWREVFGKSEEWIKQNEAELDAQDLADAPMEVPPFEATDEELEDEEVEVMEIADDATPDDEELLA